MTGGHKVENSRGIPCLKKLLLCQRFCATVVPTTNAVGLNNRTDYIMKTDEEIKINLAANVTDAQVVKRTTAAKLLDCHPSFIDTLCGREELDAVYLGTHAKRITLKSITAYISRAATTH